jgi:hypothetical protein
VRAVQDIALADGHGAATVAVYRGLVTSVLHLFGEADEDVHGFAGDAVLQAAKKEVPAAMAAAMAGWIFEAWERISDDAEVLDALSFIGESELPATPTAVLAYRRAAEELVIDAGENAAVISWAGAAAHARWLWLFGGREVELAELCAADPVLEAARRELSSDQMGSITAWVNRNWRRIDDLATERAA